MLLRRTLAAVLLAVTFVMVVPSSASAHGSVAGPVSRNYGCWQRWGSNWQATEMATQDPMCYQAWQADPNAMWNWNGLYREGVAGNHQGAIADGQLCSAGRTGDGRYNSMDTVGDWKASSVGQSFNVRLFDQAGHGADYVRVYVSRQGYDPLTQPLKWSDLQLASQIGNTPVGQWTPVTGGQEVSLPVSLSGRTGRAVVYTIWQASHADQAYYICSDIAFGGTSTPPTTPPPTSPPPAADGSCSATYAVTSSWQGAFQAAVTVTAGSSPITGWTTRLTYPGTQAVQQSWNATVTTSGAVVSATNASYNGSLNAGASATFGFIGTGTSTTPTITCTAAGSSGGGGSSGAVKIMPLGDSITGSPGCWRASLYNNLVAAGHEVDMVGTLAGQGCGVAYDGDNEGHGGFLAVNIASGTQLPPWLAATDPDVVLMHLGTNDVWNNRSPTEILAAFSTLLRQMRAQNPSTVLLVAKIIPMNPSNCAECGARAVALNNAIPAWAAQNSTTASPVQVVDQWTGFNTATDTYDGVHPNDAGNAKISAKWLAALETVLP